MVERGDMNDRAQDLLNRIEKRARKGARGFPLGTLAFYGPDDRQASKMVASVIAREGAGPSHLQRWCSEGADVRAEAVFLEEVLAFFEEHGVKSVVMPDRIIGCPHEEGVDYEGAVCPRCPYWAGRDRWTGELIG
jgi:hypothetical protein